MVVDKRTISYGLLAAIAFQVMVLAMEYCSAVYPLVSGQEIRLKTVPVDPRSLFRGNYARLNYDISRINVSGSPLPRAPRKNELVYVKLKPDEKGYYIPDGVTLTKPKKGLFIRGRNNYFSSSQIRIRYGIEAFFAPKEKALKLEKELRQDGVAVIMVASNGKATLKDVIINDGL